MMYNELRKTKEEEIPYKFNKLVESDQGNIVFV
jgi:hypothetical protein